MCIKIVLLFVLNIDLVNVEINEDCSRWWLLWENGICSVMYKMKWLIVLCFLFLKIFIMICK